MFENYYLSMNTETKDISIPGFHSQVKGSLIDVMNTLGKKYNFNTSYAPAKGFDNLVNNVSSQPCYYLVYS